MGKKRVVLGLRAWLFALAVTGIAVTHNLGYRFAFRDPHARLEVLQSSGHAYLGMLGIAGVTGLALGLLAFFVNQMTKDESAVPPSALVASAALRLFALQATGFGLLEVGERALSADAGGGGLMGNSPVLIAIALQLVFALLAAFVLLLVARTVRLVRKRRARRSDPVLPTWEPSTIFFFPRPAFVLGMAPRRGPPTA